VIPKVKDGTVILMNVPSKKVIETNTNILKEYVNKKNYNAVYVTVNKPFSELIKNFQKEKINMKKVFIIDAVTPFELTDHVRTEEAVFLGSPKVLTNISITTTSAVEKLKTARMVIFDSISTLLIHNDFDKVEEFIHFITNKMKGLNVITIMILINELTDKKSISQLGAFADEIINIE